MVLLLVIFLVLFLLVFIIGYNRIVSLEMRVEQAWADIDVQLKRISELLPNLINTLKGSATFERSIIDRVSEAYERIAKAMTGRFEERVKAVEDLVNVMYPIIFQLPNYPELKSVKGFEKVMEDIRVSIDKIAYARQFYNQAVMEFNRYIRLFPWVIIASILGKKEKPFFELREEVRKEIEKRIETGELTKEISEAFK